MRMMAILAGDVMMVDKTVPMSYMEIDIDLIHRIEKVGVKYKKIYFLHGVSSIYVDEKFYKKITKQLSYVE